MSKRRAFVRGLILFALAFTNLNDIWSPDVLPNALFAWTAIKERNVDYDEFVFRPNQPSSPGRLDSEAYFFRACGVSTATQPPKAPRSVGGPPAPGPNDHVCSVFPPGMAILALPFFAPLVIAGFDPLDLGLLVRMGHVVGALVEVLATLVLWSCVRRFVGPRWSLVLVLLYFFGTSVRTIASQALWQHSGVHLAVALALSVVLREESVGYGRELVAGLALGLPGAGRARPRCAFARSRSSGSRPSCCMRAMPSGGAAESSARASSTTSHRCSSQRSRGELAPACCARSSRAPSSASSRLGRFCSSTPPRSSTTSRGTPCR